MERPTILIISDDPNFANAATSPWRSKANIPAFILAESCSCAGLSQDSFDLTIVGGIVSESLSAVLRALETCGKPVVQISRFSGRSPQQNNTICLPDVRDWPDVLMLLAQHILDRHDALTPPAKTDFTSPQLERDAALGRYMLEVRHNLNNALTSILGNSDLILLDSPELSHPIRAQLETIRNMALRMNEIMQRFSSLQKEMQLVEQHRWSGTAVKSAAAGL